MLNSNSKPHGGAVAEPKEEHAPVWVSVGSWGLGVRAWGSEAGGKGLRVRIQGLGLKFPMSRLGVGAQVSYVNCSKLYPGIMPPRWRRR